MRPRQRGMTLIEVLIAITLVALLSAAMLFAVRSALAALESSSRRIESLRRTAGAQRILHQQVAGFLPVMARCGATAQQPGGRPVMFFEGTPAAARFVSRFSIQGGARGRAQIVELFAAGRPEGGLRLLVNEIPYTGPEGAGFFCQQPQMDAELGAPMPVFPPVEPSPRSFVLADRLAYCRFSYLQDDLVNPPQWVPSWRRPDLWPAAIRIEMAALDPAGAALPPVTFTGRIRPNRLAGERYEP
ncbi:MAG: prepilin-type N-terminal cleavage/methylation domain-containing protein [Bryobacteraceae bacterium]|nr:prepilin-type N-terminal cleavage/methylation domain-containing protein [Bryobacteraceae bacterium]MCX7603353.1 prepilin-type N-terminal cleavage/methylation domain-containing protein [Bryobacteraceae bacterium]